MTHPPQEKITLHLAPQVTAALLVYGSGVQKGKPVFLCLPAMGIGSKHYAGLAFDLARKLQTIVFVTDWRGLGTSSVRVKRGVDFGYKELTEDLQQVLQTIKTRLPNNPVYILGHSLGGQIAFLYSGWGKIPIAGIILLASCSIYYKGWNGWAAYKLLAFTKFARLLTHLYGYFPGKRVGFAGNEAKTVIQDWSHAAACGKYELANTNFDYEAATAQVVMPILAVAVANDTYAPHRAIQNLCAKFHPKSAVTHATIGGKKSHHPVTHNNCIKHTNLLLPLIETWLQQISAL
ncbi:MAG TPA: alpha/beta fold hydrolase [Chitinophagales bacterium]|nr:alpha/beta fold hydrolase [Chitinophagales bacterium]HRK28677.1 alpha/beta fold hydrolase [Chitinophagales bacterium]